jgi:hypothetical protein
VGSSGRFRRELYKFLGSTGTKADPVGCSRAGIVGSNPTGSMVYFSCECCFLSGTGLCDGHHVQRSHAECVLVSLSVIICTSNNNPLPLRRVGRRGKTKKVLVSASLQLVCR